jgi:hypothetical protein
VIVKPVLPVVAGLVAMVLPVLADLVAALLPILANLIPVPRGQLVRPTFSRQPVLERLPPLLGGTIRGELADPGSPVAQPRQRGRAIADAIRDSRTDRGACTNGR